MPASRWVIVQGHGGGAGTAAGTGCCPARAPTCRHVPHRPTAVARPLPPLQLVCDLRTNTPKDRRFLQRHARALMPRTTPGWLVSGCLPGVLRCGCRTGLVWAESCARLSCPAWSCDGACCPGKRSGGCRGRSTAEQDGDASRTIALLTSPACRATLQALTSALGFSFCGLVSLCCTAIALSIGGVWALVGLAITAGEGTLLVGRGTT